MGMPAQKSRLITSEGLFTFFGVALFGVSLFEGLRAEFWIVDSPATSSASPLKILAISGPPLGF